MKEKIFQLSTIIQVLIKSRDDNELEPMHNMIDQINNNMLQSVEEMDKTIMKIAADKKESIFDQENQSNRIALKAKQKQKVIEATQD